MTLSKLEKTAATIIVGGICLGLGLYMGGLSQTSSCPTSQFLENRYVQLGLGVFGASCLSAIVWGIYCDHRNRNL